MRWKKKLLLPLLVVSFSLLLSAFGFGKSANAIVRNVVNLSGNISGYDITFTRVSNQGVFRWFMDNDSHFTGSEYGALQNVHFGLNNTVRLGGGYDVVLDFYTLVSAYDNTALIANFCPVDDNQSGYNHIRDCKVELYDKDSFLNRSTITNEPVDDVNSWQSIANFTNYDYTIAHYVITLKSDADNVSYVNSLALYGPTLRYSMPNRSSLPNGGINSGVIVNFVFNYVKDQKYEPSAEEKMNDKDDKDRADLENQSSETDSDANSAGADASNAGTSLLGVFSAFVSALATIHETNCRLPSMSVYGLELGQMDLCTFDVPPGIIALATVGMVFIIVPLSFHLARRLVNIFRSFQG